MNIKIYSHGNAVLFNFFKSAYKNDGIKLAKEEVEKTMAYI